MNILCHKDNCPICNLFDMTLTHTSNERILLMLTLGPDSATQGRLNIIYVFRRMRKKIFARLIVMFRKKIV